MIWPIPAREPNRPGAFLGPGENSVMSGTVTIRRNLKLLADATYKVTMNSNTPAADKVIAKGEFGFAAR